MGDARHKKPAPDEPEEVVTDAFRKKVRDTLETNKRLNNLRGKRKGQPGYLISNRAELAEACGTDITMINKIIGPARETSKVDLVATSTFLGRIRRALDISEISLSVPLDRSEVLGFLAGLPDEQFKVFDEEVRRLMRQSGKVPA